MRCSEFFFFCFVFFLRFPKGFSVRQHSSEKTSCELRQERPFGFSPIFPFISVNITCVCSVFSVFLRLSIYSHVSTFPSFSVFSTLHLSFLFLPPFPAAVHRDAQAPWGLTLHNRRNKGSFLCCHAEHRLWAPSATPSKVYQQQQRWGLSDGNLLPAVSLAN